MQPGRLGLIAALVAFNATAVPAQAATITIVIQDLEFTPPEVMAAVGDTVQWVNKDVFAHTATATNGDFDVTIPPNATVTTRVSKAGTVGYYCRYHPNMKATLTVGQ